MRRRFYVSLGGVVLLVLTAAAMGVYMASDGDVPGAAKYFFVFALVCAAAGWTGYETRFNQRRSGASNIQQTTTEEGRPALKIPYSARLYAAYAVVSLTMSVMFGLGVYDSATAVGGFSTGAVVFFAPLSLLFLSLPFSMLIGRFVRGYLLVTSAGIQQRGWTFRISVGWDDIVDISPVDSGEGPYVSALIRSNANYDSKQIHKMWKQDRLPRHAGVMIPGKFMGADPALTYAILAYYCRNRAVRGELDGEAAITRARTGAFTPA